MKHRSDISAGDRRSPSRSRRGRGGQAMVESLAVMLATLLLLFGLLQVAHAFAGREILRHAAARAARARAVGFNHWMCEKVMRVAAIPASGKMVAPALDVPFDSALQQALAEKRDGALWDWSIGAVPRPERGRLEAARIPDYLASVNDRRAEHILDYEGWGDLSAAGLGGGTASPVCDDGTLTVSVRQRRPLSILVRMLNDWVGYAGGGKDGADAITLRGDFNIESHYPLYLDDHGY